MNEEQKNIETCLAEDILAEVAGVPQDAHFRSLVEEAFDPLQQSALAQAGYDDYKEVVQSHQPYTFTSSVRQMKSNLILLLRRLWRFPFGRGTTSSLSDAGSLRSLADMWSHYIDRLQGNAEYGIPSRLAQLTDLPSAPLLLSDRKISGVPDAPDGISLVNLMCSDARNGITTFTEPNNGWDLTSVAAINRIPQIFPNITKIVLGCLECHTNLDGLSTAVSIELEFPNLKRYTQPPISGHIEYMVAGTPAKMIFPELEEYSENPTTGRPAGLIYGMSNCTEVRAPKLSKVTIYSNGFGKITRCPKLQIVDFRSLRYFDLTGYSWGGYFPFQDCTNLIHLEFKEYMENVKYGDWNPTMALRTDTTAEDYVDLREDTSLANNLEQFIANFSEYIIDRLQQRTASTTLTLTLSQAVRNVLTTEQEQDIAAKYWNLSPANKTT